MLGGKNKILSLDFYEIIHILCREEDRNFCVDILSFLKKNILSKQRKYLPPEYLL